MIRARLVARWPCLLALLLARAASAQEVAVPEGETRFMVLVDRSWSMVGGKESRIPERQRRRAQKQSNFQHAVDAIVGALLDGPSGGESRLNLPRFQPGRDTVVVGRFGTDSGADSSQAWARLGDVRMDEYLQVVYSPTGQPTRQGLRDSLSPGWPLRNLNILAWAVPMGFARMRPAPGQRVQTTYLVMLNDAQMNEGSIGLENEMYRPKLSTGAGATLDRAVADLIGHVRFVKERDQGLPGAVGRATFGDGEGMIVATVYKVVPVGRGEGVPQGKPREVRAEWVREGTGWRLDASALAPEGTQGGEARLSLGSQDGQWGPSDRRLGVSLADRRPEAKGYALPVTLTLANDYPDPLLGVSRYTATYRDIAWVPPSPAAKGGLFQAVLVGLAAFAVASVLAVWVGWRRWLTRDFKITLPGGGAALDLPPLSGTRAVEGWTRVPRTVDETAFVLWGPSRLVGRFFYRKATVRWDPRRLRVAGLDASGEARVRDLPRYASFVWVARDGGTENTTLQIVRRSRTGASGQILATIHHPAAATFSVPLLENVSLLS